MKKNLKDRQKALKKILILCIVAAAAMMATINAFSLWQSDESVHVNAKEIPASTLAIGTHLIHLKALTNVHYEVAMASAGESNQTNIYYKSELADGTWFDITAASGIVDITTGGKSVSDAEIEEIFFDYHTKEDGVTYDLRTGNAVNILDISNPYDLAALPELMPLKMSYDTEAEVGKNSKKLSFMEIVLKADVKNEETDKLDQYMAALDRYYKVLSDNNGLQANKDTVMDVQESVDAARRIAVLTQLDALLDGCINSLLTDKEKRVYDSEGNLVQVIPPLDAPELQQPAEDSKTNVQTSILNYVAKALGEGTSILSKLRYELQMNLITDAEAANDAQCDEDVADIQALDNISGGRIIDRQREIGLLESKLIPQAEGAFEGDKSAGENQEYRTAVSDNSSTVILDRIAGEYYNKLFAEASELEMYLDALCKRVENSTAQSLIQEKLDKAYAYYDSIPADAFTAKANQAVQEYITWLENKLAFLIAAAGGTQGDLLGQQKEKLTEEYLAALDKNDLAGAKAIMSEINNVTAQIAELGDTSKEAALVSQYKQEALSLINDGETGNGGEQDPNMQRLKDLLDMLNAMMASNYKTAFPAVQEISDAMKAQKYGAGLGTGSSGTGSGAGSGTGTGSGTGAGSGAGSGSGSGTGTGTGAGSGAANGGANTDKRFDNLIEQAGSVLMENQGMYEAGTLGVKDPKDMEGLIQDFLNGLDGFGDQGKALIKITALNKLLMLIPGNRYYDEIQSLMSNAAVMESVRKNPYVFAKMQTMDGVYAPVTAVSAKSGLRYVWYRSRDNAVLAKGAERYEFRSFSKRVVKNNVSTDMPLPALTQNVLYLPGGYISMEWDYTAVNLVDGQYGILIDDEIDSRADELLAILQN